MAGGLDPNIAALPALPDWSAHPWGFPSLLMINDSLHTQAGVGVTSPSCAPSLLQDTGLGLSSTHHQPLHLHHLY